MASATKREHSGLALPLYAYMRRIAEHALIIDGLTGPLGTQG